MLPTGVRLGLLDSLGAIAEAGDTRDFGIRLCRELLRLLPGISASYNEMNLLTGRVAGLVHPDPGPEWTARYLPVFERHFADNPLIRHFMAGGGSELTTWRDVDPAGEFRRTPLYREFFAPNGVHSQAAFLLPAPPGITVAIALHRGGEDWTADERALVARLRPYLVNLYRLVTRAEAGRAVEAALADDGWSAILVDDTGLIVESNAVAERIGKAAGVDLRVGARLGDEQLWAEFSHRSHDLWAAAQPAAPGPLPAPMPFEARLLRLRIGPHVVWVREPRTVTVDDALAFGLTRRQAQIALHLVDGLTNDQIGRRLGIAAGTVRKHLEGVFARLGVRSRAAAVAVLQSGPSAAPPAPGSGRR